MALRTFIATAAVGLALAGCAADGSMSTASIDSSAKQEKVASVDPVCVALSNQIDTLRREGSIEGLEKAAAGKGTSVKVKRDSLVKQSELNRTYAEFQAKCGPKLPLGQQTAQVPAVAPVASATVPAAPAKKQ